MALHSPDDLFHLLQQLLYGTIPSGEVIAQLAAQVEEHRLEIEDLKAQLATKDDTIALLRARA